MKEKDVEGGTHYTNLFTDESGREWNILVREGGSVSLYTTTTGYSAVGVVYDTIDIPLNDTSRDIIRHLKDAAEGISLLLATIKEPL
jgi:hypothetical protein